MHIGHREISKAKRPLSLSNVAYIISNVQLTSLNRLHFQEEPPAATMPNVFCPQRVKEKSGDLEYVTILDGYSDKFLKVILLWEQEVGGSNPLAAINPRPLASLSQPIPSCLKITAYYKLPTSYSKIAYRS